MSELYIYRASGLGNCEKALIAQRMGYEPMSSVYENGKLSKIFKEGDLHEAAIVEELNSIGREVTLQQHEVNLMMMPGVLVQGHLDGVLENKVLEIKSMGDSTFKQFSKYLLDTPGIVQKYKWQFSAYMIAMEREMILVCKNRNTGEVIEVPIHEPFYDLSTIRARIARIEDVARSGDLPVKCVNPQYPCPFYYLHEDGEEIDFVVDEAVESYVKVYEESKALEEKYKKQKQETRKKLDEIVKAKGDGRKIETPTHRITFYPIKGRKKIDYKRLIEDHDLDVRPYETMGEASEGLRITPKTQDEGLASEPGDKSGDNTLF